MSKNKKVRIDINELVSPKQLKAVRKIIDKSMNSDAFDAVESVLEDDFESKDLGTNRLIMISNKKKYKDFIFKFAVDEHGVQANFREFYDSDQSDDLTQSYSISDEGEVVVQERIVPLTSKDMKHKETKKKVVKMLNRLSKKFLLVDCKLSNFKNFGFRGKELVLCDHGDLVPFSKYQNGNIVNFDEDFGVSMRCRGYKKGTNMMSRNPKRCKGKLVYTKNFDALVCDKCGAICSVNDAYKFFVGDVSESTAAIDRNEMLGVGKGFDLEEYLESQTYFKEYAQNEMRKTKKEDSKEMEKVVNGVKCMPGPGYWFPKKPDKPGAQGYLTQVRTGDVTPQEYLSFLGFNPDEFKMNTEDHTEIRAERDEMHKIFGNFFSVILDNPHVYMKYEESPKMNGLALVVEREDIDRLMDGFDIDKRDMYMKLVRYAKKKLNFMYIYRIEDEWDKSKIAAIAFFYDPNDLPYMDERSDWEKRFSAFDALDEKLRYRISETMIEDGGITPDSPENLIDMIIYSDDMEDKYHKLYPDSDRYNINDTKANDEEEEEPESNIERIQKPEPIQKRIEDYEPEDEDDEDDFEESDDESVEDEYEDDDYIIEEDSDPEIEPDMEDIEDFDDEPDGKKKKNKNKISSIVSASQLADYPKEMRHKLECVKIGNYLIPMIILDEYFDENNGYFAFPKPKVMLKNANYSPKLFKVESHDSNTDNFAITEEEQAGFNDGEEENEEIEVEEDSAKVGYEHKDPFGPYFVKNYDDQDDEPKLTEEESALIKDALIKSADATGFDERGWSIIKYTKLRSILLEYAPDYLKFLTDLAGSSALSVLGENYIKEIFRDTFDDVVNFTDVDAYGVYSVKSKMKVAEESAKVAYIQLASKVNEFASSETKSTDLLFEILDSEVGIDVFGDIMTKKRRVIDVLLERYSETNDVDSLDFILYEYAKITHIAMVIHLKKEILNEDIIDDEAKSIIANEDFDSFYSTADNEVVDDMDKFKWVSDELYDALASAINTITMLVFDKFTTLEDMKDLVDAIIVRRDNVTDVYADMLRGVFEDYDDNKDTIAMNLMEKRTSLYPNEDEKSDDNKLASVSISMGKIILKNAKDEIIKTIDSDNLLRVLDSLGL